MKKMFFVVALVTAVAGTSTFSNAELKVVGSGATMAADTSAFPPAMKEVYPLFEKKCIKCHGMDRTIVTIQSGMTPSGTPFDNPAVDAYMAKMLRKPDADINKQEAKKFSELMKYMLDEAAK